MSELRVKVSSVIENQLPQFIRENSPLLIDFLRQYYIAVESNGQVLDILENIDKYVKVDFITSYISNTNLTKSVSFFDNVIEVESTFGFPNSYGLLKINDEIISYESKTDDKFINCYRGFSGVESYGQNNFERDLVFSKTIISEHVLGNSVENLSFIFLKEFLQKTKSLFTPGFEDRNFVENLNENLFIKQSKDFYSSKGTKSSFEILFNSLYGEKVSVIDPSQFLIRPSDSKYLVTRDIVVEEISGNPEELKNQTIFQDDNSYFVKSSAAVTNVEKFIRNEKVYYTLSLDYDYNRDIESRGSVIGEFSVHPKTIIINNILNQQSYIDVDSTIGFPNSGELVVNINGVNFFLQYKSKTLNQFLECENVPQIPEKTDIRLNSYIYGYSGVTGNEIRMRIGGVLSNLDIIDDTFLSSVGDTIKITSPGKILTEVQSKNWFYNISITHDIIGTPLSGLINTFDEHNFIEGDEVIVEVSDGSIPFKTKVLKVNNKKSISINPQLPSVDSNLFYKIKRNLVKCKFKNYPEISVLNANIQNVYYDYIDKSIYVASPSIPNYSNRQLNITDGSILVNGSQTNNTITALNHPFLSGDVVYYSYGNSNENLSIDESPYFVKKISDNQIRLFKSKEDLYLNNFVKFDNLVVSNNKLSFFNLFGKRIESQKLLRKISKQPSNITQSKTAPGYTGMLLNGVEILNYKSNDYIYYGEIEQVQAVSSLEYYDVINPPKVVIQDFNGVGVGASVTLHINGNLKKINIIDSGFDYIEEPKVIISGGNGTGAIAVPKLVSFQHIVEFNSGNSSVVNLVNDTIIFSDDHKFRTIEEVIYRTENQNEIGGLNNESRYFIKSINAKTIKLYLRMSDAVSNINPISLTTLGSGIHSFTSTKNKRKIGSVNITDAGQNYKSKKVTVESKNINFRKNTVVAKNHNYSNKDIISYYSSANEIGGVLPGNYFVKVVSDDEFNLVEIIENSELGSDFNFKNNTILNFENIGSGVHYFNYPEITVSIEGIVGVNTFSISNSIAQIQPIFRGSIENVFVVSSGMNYGTPDIINYERPPIFTLQNGSGALVKPMILNGKIISVLVLNTGSNYSSPPELEIIGQGQGAILTPIIQNDKIVNVKVISGGFGYEQNKTEIKVKVTEGETSFKAKIKSWNINSYFRFLNSPSLFQNNALLQEGLNKDFNLQYSHLALPNAIRELVKTSKIFEDVEITISDIENDTKNSLLRIHSPIVGWAYDGNPIYGPYGFDLPTGGIVRRMISGYKLQPDSTKRPNYQTGLLVEDYQFTDSGDLDESNGRYGITPEFPNGTYAYFCPIDEEFNPVFPYIIGDYYRSEVIKFNFDKQSNQDNININQKKWIRNTEPYKFLSYKTNYDYILNPNSIKNQDSEISSIEYGTLNKIEIELPGDNYKVGDRVILKTSDNDFGSGSSAEISKISGKNVIDINTDISVIENIQFAKSNIFDSTIGISSSPHNLKTGDYISICECSINSNLLDDNFYQVKVFLTELKLRSNIGVTGEITYFDVYGNIKYPYVMEDDIFIIDNEKIKILSIDLTSKRIKVLRGYDSTPIEEHSANTLIVENPRKFYLNIPFEQNFEINRRYYFDPSETVNIETSIGIPTGTTVSISTSYNNLTVRGSLYYPTSNFISSSVDVIVLYHPSIDASGVTPSISAANFLNIVTNTSQVNIRDKIIFSVAYPQDAIPAWLSNNALISQEFPELLGNYGGSYANFLFGDNIQYAEAALLWVKNNLNNYLSTIEVSKTTDKIFTFGHSQGGYLAHRLNTMYKVDGVIPNSPGPIDLLTRCSTSESQGDNNISCLKIKTSLGSTSVSPQSYDDVSLSNFLSVTLSPVLFTQALDDITGNSVGTPQVSNMQNIMQPGLESCINCSPVEFKYYDNGGHAAFVTNTELQQDIREFFNSGINDVYTRSIYLPNHNLNTGDNLIYTANTGVGIIVSNNGIDEFILEEETSVFVAKFSDDFIGISTGKVGLSSDGDFIGIGTETSILYFNSFGQGDIHSLTNNYSNIFKAKLNNIVSKITTEEQHFLEVGDNVDLELKSLDTRIFKLYYDFNSRNLIFDKQEIDDVDDESNILVIQNHNFVRGQKVLFNSFNPPVGVSDGEKFYIIKVNSNQIKLSRTYYGSLTNTDIVPIEILGTYDSETNPFFLSLVNPPLSLYGNERVIFDLSDASLEGFDFNLYEDDQYRNIFYGIDSFNVEKIGEISKPNCKLILTITNNIIKEIYYNLSIPDEQNVFFEKLEYFVDNVNISNHNKILITKSVYYGKHTVTGIGSTYFQYNLKNSPENLNYVNNINSIINYTTNSKNSLGPISKVKINSGGRNYKKLPIIQNILSEFGSGAILNPKTTTIGKINKISIKDIGFDYFTDKTLRPSAKIPEILRINPLSALDSIKVIFPGENYNISPNLVLIDGLTNKVVSEVSLNYILTKNFIEIIRNTTGIFNVTPKIVPVNNSNGINISDIVYNSTQKEINVFLRDSYSTITEFPFQNEDLVLIENTNVLSNTGKSYNSSIYDYKLFPIKEIHPQLGGENAYITLDASKFIEDDELFGKFDVENSFGVVTPEKYFPIFEISLKKNIFFVGEKIADSNDNNIGIVESWDKENELLKVNTTQDFAINSIVIGKSSNSRGLIIDKIDFKSFYDISSSSIVIRSWQDNSGFLNDDLQRIADNYYYQYFSYSLKSRVQIQDWDNAVSSLNHTSGFKKFSDLSIEVQDKNYSGIQTSQNNGNFTSIAQLISVSDINCKNDYDLVSENSNIFEQKLTSDQIIFQSKELNDYFKCIGNRVLQIDDISNQFRSSERLNIVNRFIL